MKIRCMYCGKNEFRRNAQIQVCASCIPKRKAEMSKVAIKRWKEKNREYVLKMNREYQRRRYRMEVDFREAAKEL